MFAQIWLFYRKSNCNYIKKETLAQVFSCEFYEISKNTFSYRTSRVVASGNRWAYFRNLCYASFCTSLLQTGF